jgi:hypothetical protein
VAAGFLIVSFMAQVLGGKSPSEMVTFCLSILYLPNFYGINGLVSHFLKILQRLVEVLNYLAITKGNRLGHMELLVWFEDLPTSKTQNCLSNYGKNLELQCWKFKTYKIIGSGQWWSLPA